MKFIPPFSLGGFKPSPATLSEFIYQIWLYLQNNPIMSEGEIDQQIEETIPPAVKDYVENNPEMSQSIAEIVDEYLVENPPEAPVQSVNQQTGNVVIDYKSLVPANIQIPVFIHNTAAAPTSTTLIGLRNNGFRFTFNSETARLSVINADYTLTEIAAGDVLSVNGKTGAVTLTAADIEIDPQEGDTTVKDVADTVDDLQTDVGGLQTDVGSLQTTVGGLQTTVGGLQTNVTALQQLAVTRTLLWTNPNTSGNSLPSGTVITLSSSNYDVLEIWISPTNEDPVGTIINYYGKGIDIFIAALRTTTGQASDSWIMTRKLTYNSDTQFTSGGGVIIRWGASAAEGPYNWCCSPTRIYGIKY